MNRANPLTSTTFPSGIPKRQRIVWAVKEAIETGKLRLGDRLPSLKAICRDFNVALNTAVRAYEELKQEGIIQSTFRFGFVVAREELNRKLNVMLLFDEMNFFKAELYNAFRVRLANHAHITLFCHYHNLDVFRLILQENRYRFTHFVVIPHPSARTPKLLATLPVEKLLLLDQLHHCPPSLNFLSQDFENDTYACLRAGADRLRRYSQFHLILPKGPGKAFQSPFNDYMEKGFLRFCREFDVPHVVETSHALAKPQAGHAYMIIAEDDLFLFISNTQQRGWVLGEDIGVISYNDSAMKTVMEGGLSTISSNFTAMGETAAECLLENRPVHAFNPARLILRKSL